MDFILEHYLIFKALHIIAVISWMAALLYLPRLYVYHADALKELILSEQFLLMEARLIKIIMNPAMIFTWLLGILMIIAQGFDSFGLWMHIKLFFLLVLSAFHGFAIRHHKKFKTGKNSRSSLYFRVFNEVPSLLMVIIILLAVIKPF